MDFSRSFLMTSFMILLPCYGEEAVSFNRDVRSILSKNCYACHGPDEKKMKSELRLDTPERAYGKGESGKLAIVPYKPEESELYKRITNPDEEEVMPPADSHFKITEQERETLRRWISQGAKYEGHWAFAKNVKAGTPKEKSDSDVIDDFISQYQQKKNLHFAAEADRATLLRRISFDLTGLPPTADELNDFLSDASPNAYEKQIDRLLASPHFGEQMAVAWLDAARYADTNGYSIDGGRHAWLWRDWVIKAYNDNLPYDQFLIKQLAGDLLENKTEADVIATAFQRNHSITHEGGTIPEENLTNYAADRVKTFGEAVLGLTLGCAQCHDHKFDPVSQKEYYQMFAFFNSLDDAGLAGDSGVNAAPSIDASSPLATNEEAETLKNEIANLEKDFAVPMPELQAAWEKSCSETLATRGKDLSFQPVEILKVTTPDGDPKRLKITSDSAITIPNGESAAYSITAKLPTSLAAIKGFRIIFEPDARAGGTIGFGDGSFVMNTVSLNATTFPAGNVDINSALKISRFTASQSRAEFPTSNLFSSDPRNGWAPPLASKKAQHLTISLEKPLDAKTTPYLSAALVFIYNGKTTPAKFRIHAFTGTTDDSEWSEEITAALLTDPPLRSPEQASMLQDYFKKNSDALSPLRYQLANLKERLDVVTKKHSVLVMNQSSHPRKTHILERGVYSAPRSEVTADTPAFLPPLQAKVKENPTRLDLAYWTTRADNPLTARVAANRLWEKLFGRGLSVSSADFGSQGTMPTHPELLDWLAATYREKNWDTKGMLKTILLTRTYRQSSNTNSEQLKIDPLNESLARGARFRLSAEAIRDQALALSGLLVERLGGPSVKTYQPGDLWRPISHYGSTPATAQTFIQDHGEKLYRRSLYTYWKRTLPPPNLANFDAPTREVCTIGRTATNTPLQALVLLNDPQFVEAARHFALRILSNKSAIDDRSRIQSAFLSTLSRPATEKEINLLLDSLHTQEKIFQAHPEKAEDYLHIGEKITTPSNITLPSLAAWSMISQTLLNLSETITRR